MHTCSSRVLLPAPGSPPDQHHGAGHQAAAQHPVELGEAGGQPGRLLGLHLRQPSDLARGAGEAEPPRSLTGPTLTRDSEFQALQAEHWPCHFMCSAPQSVQT